MRCAIILLTLLAGLGLRAEGLSWEKTTVSVQAAPLADQVETRFRFANATTATVEITRVHTSCGCTTAKLDKTSYAPGETGEIEATLKVDGASGTVSKNIYVEWNDGTDHRSTLTFEAVTPEYVHMEPGYVVWEHGEAVKAKTIKLEVTWDEPIRLTGVTVSNPAINAELKTIEEGRRYELIVTPDSTEDMVYSSILIQSDWPAAKPKVFQTFSRVLMDRKQYTPTRLQRFWRWLLQLIS